jgi:hypothetical protein
MLSLSLEGLLQTSGLVLISKLVGVLFKFQSFKYISSAPGSRLPVYDQYMANFELCSTVKWMHPPDGTQDIHLSVIVDAVDKATKVRPISRRSYALRRKDPRIYDILVYASSVL